MIQVNEPTAVASAASKAARGDAEPFIAPAARYAAAVPWSEVGHALKESSRTARQGAADFAQFIFRMLRALFQRIARLFGVSVTAPGDESAAPQAEAAMFAGADGKSVSDAGLSAAAELGRVSDAVKDLRGHDLDEGQLNGEGAEAYARLVLARLSRAVNEAHKRYVALDEALGRHAAQIALELGVPVGSARAMLEQAVVAGPSTGLGDPQMPALAAAIEHAKRFAEARLERAELLGTLAMHAAAVTSAAGGRAPVLDAVSWALAQVADAATRSEVEAQLVPQNCAKSSSSAVHSAKHNVAAVDGAVLGTADKNVGPESASSNVLDMSGRGARSRLARFRLAGDGEPDGPGPTQRDRG
jgi:signal transduction histidine kinase